MIIQLYTTTLYDFDFIRYVCGAIAKHNGLNSVDHYTFTSNMNEQIVSLANNQEISIPSEFFQNIWSTDNFNQVYDGECNTTYNSKFISHISRYFSSGIMCKIIGFSSCPSMFISKYNHHLLFREKNFDANYGIYSRHSCRELPASPDLSKFHTIYADDNIKMMRKIEEYSTGERGFEEYWKISLKFPEKKIFDTDCSLICVK